MVIVITKNSRFISYYQTIKEPREISRKIRNNDRLYCFFSEVSRQNPRPGTSKHEVDTITFDTAGFSFGLGLPFDGTPLRRRDGKFNR